jgi:phosphatidylglycerophosphatase A
VDAKITGNVFVESQMKRTARAIILFISQGAYVGRFPVAPGTAGTVLGVLLYLWIKVLSPLPYGIICLLIGLVGTWAAGRAEVMLGSKDSPTIVIDEITGYLVAMFMAPPAWGYVVAGFVLFRMFDIVKPFPLKQLQKVHGGLGVMLDDIGAGVYTGIVLQFAADVLKSA